jgi:restriction endonuclease S subunit
VVIVEESGDRTPEQAAILTDPRLKPLRDQRKLLILDQDAADSQGQPAAELSQYDGQPLPRVIGLDSSGVRAAAADLPATADGLMELLKEKRQAVISHAVTKGLDPHAPIKPSGIEWLGDVPAHWEVAKTSHFFKAAMGQTILAEDLVEDGEWPVFSATDGDHYFGRVNDPKVRLDVGDIVIPARGNSIGSVKLVVEPATTTQTTIYCKPLSPSKLKATYVYQYFRGCKESLFYFTQTAIPQITVKEVKANVILIPPFTEQTAIVEFLETELAKFDTLTAEAQRAIDLLQERRTALISASVTGQIDVRQQTNN